MVYTAFTWVGSSDLPTATAINSSNLNHFETQYEAMTSWASTRYATLASPTFTGLIYSSTPSFTDMSTKLATTAYVQNRVSQVHTDLHVTGLWTTAA